MRQALSDVGCSRFSDVLRLLTERGLGSAASERTFRRVYDNGPSREQRPEGRQAAEAIAQLTADPDALMVHFRRCWSSEFETGAAGAEGLRRNWFAVVPRQHGRTFASVDLVEVTNQRKGSIWGTITRVSPDSEQEAGLRWDFRGILRGDRGIFLTFSPIGPNNESSAGVIFMRRIASRSQSYEGGYVRLDEGTGEFLSRSYGWYQTVPQTALPRVALLDLDNTLRSGWLIREWVEFLAGEQMDGAAKCLERIETAFRTFGEEGAVSHDALSNDTAQAYAAMMRGKPPSLVEELAADFAVGEGERYRFVAPLVECLKELSVAPIIVSGAPAELVSRHAHDLAVEEFSGLTLRLGADGFFDGTIVSNPGLGSVKRRMASETRTHQRSVVLAVGDSDSDRLMLQAAPSRIVVGGLVPDPSWPAESVLAVDPGGATPSQVVDWLRTRIDPDERFGPATDLSQALLGETRAAKRRSERPGDTNP